MRLSKYKLTLLATAAIILASGVLALIAPATTLAVAPKNGKCPTGYYLRDQDQTCIKIAKPPKKITAAYCKANGFDGVRNGKCYSNQASACVNSDFSCSTSGGDKCGSSGDGQVVTAISFGCTGKGNAIADLTFAIIRFLSNGVGLVVVGSIVFAGIQYTVSRADPQATAAAQERIRSSIIALIIYIFAYAILNYVIPKGFLHQ